MLAAHDISAGRGNVRILQKVSLTVKPGEIVAVAGPNGAGKSTLLHVLSGALAPSAGQVSLDGQPLARWKPAALARRRAVLPQHAEPAFGFRVLDLVLIGRTSHAGLSSARQDLSAAHQALNQVKALHLADRIYTTLSGGEQQRVSMARILAQVDGGGNAPGMARYLLLDEPTSSLDLSHQHALLTLARRATQRNIGVLAILHDLNLAAMYADRIFLLHQGRVVGNGSPDQVLTRDAINHVFDLAVDVLRHPTRNCPHIVSI